MFFTLWELIIVNKQLTHLTLKRNTFEASIWITICKIFHKMEGLLRNKQNQFRLCFHFHHCILHLNKWFVKMTKDINLFITYRLTHFLSFLWVCIIFFYFIHTSTGTESEISFSLLNGGRGGTNRCNGLDTSTASTRILMSPGSKAVKIAAISGKPRVQRYLSRECEFAFIFTHM